MHFDSTSLRPIAQIQLVNIRFLFLSTLPSHLIMPVISSLFAFLEHSSRHSDSPFPPVVQAFRGAHRGPEGGWGCNEAVGGDEHDE